MCESMEASAAGPPVPGPAEASRNMQLLEAEALANFAAKRRTPSPGRGQGAGPGRARRASDGLRRRASWGRPAAGTRVALLQLGVAVKLGAWTTVTVPGQLSACRTCVFWLCSSYLDKPIETRIS